MDERLLCEICKTDRKNAATFCAECAQYFCESCSSIHQNIRTTSLHTTINVTEVQKQEVNLKNCEPCDQQGKTIQASTFCPHPDCNEHFCDDCTIAHAYFRSTKSHIPISVEQKTKKGNRDCDPCKQQRLSKRAKYFCPYSLCKEFFCDDCIISHRVTNATKSHTPIPVKQKQTFGNQQQPLTPPTLHKQENIGPTMACQPIRPVAGNAASTAPHVAGASVDQFYNENDYEAEDVPNITDKELNDWKIIIKEKGITGLQRTVYSKLDTWKDVPLHIAVTGNPGVGKSSLINVLCGLEDSDPRAAAVGVIETTKVAKAYKHPGDGQLVLWDLPGVGTPNFPRENYLKMIEFEKFDFFLILSKSRFTENDVWLAEQAKRDNKKFYFIRTKIDEDVANSKRTFPEHDAKDVVKRIRDDCIARLDREGFGDSQVFIVSNYKVSEYKDFDIFASKLIEDAPSLKKEAFVLTLSTLTKGIIRAKEEVLKKRIYFVSIASAAAGAIPIPGIDAAVDIGILIKEATFYKQQLGLDDEAMQINADVLKTSVDTLKSVLALESLFFTLSTKGITSLMVGASNATENVLKYALPVIGSILAGGVSYGTSVTTLKYILNAMVKDALKVNAEIIRQKSIIYDNS